MVGAHFLGDTAVLVLGEEALLLVPRQGDMRRTAAFGRDPLLRGGREPSSPAVTTAKWSLPA